MNHSLPETVLNHTAPDQVPVLTHPIPEAEVPLALKLALDARMAEKQALLDLSDELVQKLKPELERLSAELVQRALEGLWQKRASKYQM